MRIQSITSFLAALVVLFSLPAFAADPLHVEGNKILYGVREVMLQGVAVGDPLLARKGRPLSDYKKIARDWNANTVRISIHPGTWRQFGREKFLASLQKNVDAALKAKLFVIITWQAIGIPDQYTQAAHDELNEDLYDSDFDLAMEFWEDVAQAFGQDGRILFELWNEPVDGEHAKAEWRDLKPYWEKLTRQVRRFSNNVVIVTSGGWGYNLQGVRASPMTDKNTAYAWHVYAGTDDDDPEAWERNLDGLEQSKPVIVTEWGFEADEENVSYYSTAIDYGYLFADRFLRDKQLHHTAWCWHPLWTPRMFYPDWQHLTEFGSFVKEILWRTDKNELVRP